MKYIFNTILSFIKRNYLTVFTLFSIITITGCLTAMAIINIRQADEHVNYSPNFPVYREADTTLTALIKSELLETGRNAAKTQRSMEGTNTSLILATIGILAGLFFNPLLLKVLSKVKAVDEKVDKIDATNIEQHTILHNELKIVNTENKTLSNLNEILNHHLEIAPNELSAFIAHEGRRLLYFAEVTMNSKFDYSVIGAAKIKLDIAKKEGREEVKDRGADFKKLFIKLQCEGVDKLYVALTEIVLDQTYNSKHNRFRMACEQFLSVHLTGILDIQRELDSIELASLKHKI